MHWHCRRRTTNVVKPAVRRNAQDSDNYIGKALARMIRHVDPLQRTALSGISRQIASDEEQFRDVCAETFERKIRLNVRNPTWRERWLSKRS